MSKANTLCALDVGSSKIAAILAREDLVKSNIQVLTGAQVPCHGLKGGVVVSIPETARSIAQAVELCEERVKDADMAPVDELLLTVRGNHIQSFNNKGAFNIARTDKEITAADVESVLNIAHAVPMSPDREVLHVIAQDFWVDRQKGVPNPVGMEGSLLEADVHILTATASHLNNIIKAVAQAGFRANRLAYGLFALGEAVVTPEEKEQGCLLLDLGGQTLGLGVYSEGSLRHSKELSVGSDALTRDLAYALRTSLLSAQRLKEEHGACLTNLVSSDEEVEYHGIDGREVRRAKKRAIIEILQPRLEEIFVMIQKDLETSGLLEVIVPGGVIVTGGGSQLRGIIEASTELLNVPSRLGLPQLEGIMTPADIASNPSYATVLALVRFAHQPPLWHDKTNGRNHGP
ncbi:MAG: cell division protein FtsA, partial [Elusimicrobia bacterium]|nr:cell division protein FtsA [Elusimicrobiota bacterium]